jgi:hypothetical protein
LPESLALNGMEGSLASILQAALKPDSKVFNLAARNNPPKQVGVGGFRKACEQFFDSPPEYLTFATPDVDMEKAEGLLDLKKGTLGTYYVQTLKSHEYCSGRVG